MTIWEQIAMADAKDIFECWLDLCLDDYYYGNIWDGVGVGPLAAKYVDRDNRF